MKSLIEILRYTHGLAKLYGGITLTSILVALTGIAIPFVIAEATNLMVEVVGGRSISLNQVLLLAALLFGFDLANTLIRNFGGYLGDMMAARLREQLSTVYYDHLLKLPQSYYDQELTGTIINRLNRAITELGNFLNMFANTFFQMILTIIITVAIILTYSWQLAALVVVMYPLFMWLTTLTSKKWQRLQAKKNHETDVASGRFAEVVAQMKVVKSYVQEKLEYRKFEKSYRRTVDITKKQSSYWHRMDVLRGAVLSLIFFAIFAYIFVQTAEQNFAIGDMVLLITLINGLRMPLFNMSFIVDSFQKAIAGSRDVLEALRVEPVIADAPGAVSLMGASGEVKFEDVSFSYGDKSKPVINGISFDLAKGEHVALVSESGGGKTTITNLLMRLYEPSSGVIYIDGKDISNLKQGSLRANIATVFQDPALFSGTIKENIAYGKPRATFEEIVAAAKASNAAEFIENLEKGYDTEIGERGLKLSGGQKQRIAIARAILKDAPILVLDEATSALDSRSERLVQQALDRLMKGRTTLIIAHRLSTIASVDRIVTLKGGRIDEIGSPAELSETGGIYSKLLSLQQSTGGVDKEKLAKYDIRSSL
ncbi:iron ABC transporter ATP-binding protein [Candidatus Saccharibacteria bacterium 32-49-12]|nr:MAG: iron ABC transporter ATP-binding protein [Candidatus Saccharibacteria bacterium 32-49-12]